MNRRGQALLELAIFGMVCLAAVGFLIRMGMMMNFNQEIRMAAFRKALAAAEADNASDEDSLGTLYHYIADRQMPSPTDGFLLLPRTRTEASAFVEWGDRFTMAYDLPDEDSGRRTHLKYVVRSNNQERIFRGDDFPTDDSWQSGAITLNRHAFQSITRNSTTTNSSNATTTQTGAGASLVSGTGTTSSTTINTEAGDTIVSSIGSGASFP